MRSEEAEALVATINGDYPDWEAKVEITDYPFAVVVATFEEGGVHRLHSEDEWEEVKALIYGYDEDEDLDDLDDGDEAEGEEDDE